MASVHQKLKGLTKRQKKNLVNILIKLRSNTRFNLDSKKDNYNSYIYGENDSEDKDWVWIYHHVSTLDELKYNEIKDELRNCLSFLETEATEALKAQKN